MALRFVLIWTVLSAASQGALIWVSSAMLSAGPYSNTDAITLASYLLGPAAQWIALRFAGVAWRTEWLVATLAGSVLVTAFFDVTQMARLARPLLQSPLTFVIVPAAVVAVLQWFVLRRHVRRHLFWFGAAVGVIALTVALRWALTGMMVPSARLSAGHRLAIAGATGLVQGASLVWLLLSPRDQASPALRSGRTWTVIEWATVAAFSVMFIFAATRLLAEALATSSGPQTYLQAALLPGIAGVVIGVMQWVLLRRRLPISRFWIVVSAGAMAVPVLGLLVPIVQMYVIYYTMIAMRMIGAFAIIGAWFGLAQWLVLRRHVRAAFLWVPATALAWSAWHLQYLSFRVSLVTIGLLGGAICGAVVAFLPVREKPAPAFSQVGLSG